MWHMTRFARWTALAVSAALLAAGCSGGSSDDESDGTALGWGRCEASDDAPAPGDDWQCGTLEVPLDWSKPDGETIELALIRAKATGDDRLGSLLFNFGGPGGSGVS